MNSTKPPNNAHFGGTGDIDPKIAQILFIVGRGRSGTTLIESMLDMHPSVSVAPECLFIVNLYSRYHRRAFSKADILALYDDLLREKRIQTWNLDNDRLKDDLLSLPDGTVFAEVCKSVLLSYARRQGKNDVTIVGDKNHHNSLFIPQLAATFPDARFLHVVRDYRDNVLSHRKVSFEVNNAAALAYRWKEYHATIQADAPANRCLLLRYEDLVTEPETQLRRVCAFLGIELHSDMLAHHKRYRPTMSDPWQPNLKKAVSADRAAAWKREMSQADIIKCDLICAELGKQFGYQPIDQVESSETSLLRLTTLPGIAYGWLRTWLERALFRFPLGLRSLIINASRTINKTAPDVRSRTP